MTKLAQLVCTVAIVAGSSACALEGEDRDLYLEAGQPLVEVWAYDGTEVIERAEEIEQPTDAVVDVFEVLVDDAHPDEGICACESIECVRNHVVRFYGCGLCVWITCGDMPVGGCYPCTNPNGAGTSQSCSTRPAQ